jgi:hypothetical protein
MSFEAGPRAWMPVAHHVRRDSFGKLVFTDEQGIAHVGVVPIQAFPIEAPSENISLVGPEGHELAFIQQLSGLDVDTRRLLQEELTQREFIPVIDKLMFVSTYSTPSTWQVRTDRGITSFVLKGEEDIRRLKGNGLLITDSHGVTYRVLDMRALDRLSRRMLDRFL